MKAVEIVRRLENARAFFSARVVVTAISALLSMRECAAGTRGGAAARFFE
ncbi:hypothetical protein PPH94_033745 [Burkholderia cepacia]|nr:hypothetical protein [Burkholderia cepacia]MDC6098420.1 hypothetical protein [Burkholderia cepacia]